MALTWDSEALAVHDPRWDEAGKVHDWRNHVSEQVQGLWFTFTEEQRAALYRQADEFAGREEWD